MVRIVLWQPHKSTYPAFVFPAHTLLFAVRPIAQARQSINNCRRNDNLEPNTSAMGTQDMGSSRPKMNVLITGTQEKRSCTAVCRQCLARRVILQGYLSFAVQYILFLPRKVTISLPATAANKATLTTPSPLKG